MTAFDIILVFGILVFIVLIIWSRVQHQRMIDTLNEIKEFVKGLKQ